MRHLARMLTIAPTLALLGPVQTTIQARAEAKLELAVDCPRRAVYRGETLQVVVRCKNLSPEPVRNTTVAVDAAGVITWSQDAGSIGTGERWAGTFRIPTRAIRAGKYELCATATCTAGAEVTVTGPLTVGRRPNPNRLMVWLWGGGGNAWYMRHGFTSWYGAGWRQATADRTAATRQALDAALAHGGHVSIFPNGGLRDLADQPLEDPDALTESVYREILRFRDRGGLVIADQYLGADIPGTVRFDFDFTYRSRVSAKAIAQNVAYAEWNDHLEPDSAELKTASGITALDDQRIMESYAARLKERLRGQVDPAVDCAAPTVLLNMLERDGVKYLVVINDKRTYDRRVGKYKGVLGKLLPQTATIVLGLWDWPNLAAYDMLNRQALELDEVDGTRRFDVDLTELGGTIVALYPSALGPMRIEAPPALTAGIPAPIRIAWDDVSGNPLPGLQPVEVTIVSSGGQKSDYSDYYCAERGSLTLDFVPARNDQTGRWKIKAVDLTSGQVAEKEFELNPGR